MSQSPSREEALFADALARPVNERGAFLAKVCGANVELLAHLVALVAAHEGSDSVFEPPDAHDGDPDFEETPGNIIGRYKLLEKLGEGGCGAVWVAEQREPVKRRVALKIIKLGMDTRQALRVSRPRYSACLVCSIAGRSSAGELEGGVEPAGFPRNGSPFLSEL